MNPVDEPALVITEIRAVDEQVARGQAPLELLVGRDDEEIDIRVRAGVTPGDRAADDHGAEARIVAVGVGQAVDGPLVVVADVHASSIAGGRQSGGAPCLNRSRPGPALHGNGGQVGA